MSHVKIVLPDTGFKTYSSSAESTKVSAVISVINDENCSLSTVLTATYQKLQKHHKIGILPTITSPTCQLDTEYYHLFITHDVYLLIFIDEQNLVGNDALVSAVTHTPLSNTGYAPSIIFVKT